MKKNAIAIIPARGGSKRLPRKNILPISGNPVITYPLKTAIESNLFDQVLVSSEDTEIIETVSKFDCRVVKRPERLAQDTSTVVEVCAHVLNVLSREGALPAYFCLIYATAVFLKKEDLVHSFELFFKEPLPDVIMGVSEFNLQPMQALFKTEDGFMHPRWPDQIKKQSQRQPDFVASNGTLYWSRTDFFLKNNSFYTEKLKGYTIPKYRAIDIDTPEDFEFAKKLAPVLLDKTI